MSASNTTSNARRDGISLYSILTRKFAGILSADDCALLSAHHYATEETKRDSIRDYLDGIADAIGSRDIGEFLDYLRSEQEASESADVEEIEDDTDSLAEALAQRSALQSLESIPVLPVAPSVPVQSVKASMNCVLELCKESTHDTTRNVPASHRFTDTVIVGSDIRRCDIVIGARRTMARGHAKLIRQGECWVIEPIQDLVPTYLGRRILSLNTRAHVKHGDMIQFGDEHYYARLVPTKYTGPILRCDRPTLAELVGAKSTKTDNLDIARPETRPVVIDTSKQPAPLKTIIRKEVMSDKPVLYTACADILDTAVTVLSRAGHSAEENSEFAEHVRSLESIRDTLRRRGQQSEPANYLPPMNGTAVAPVNPVAVPVVASVQETKAPTVPVAPAAPVAQKATAEPKTTEPKQGESVRVNGFTIPTAIPSDQKLKACGVPMLAAHCRHHGITEYGDKGDMIRRLQEKRDSKTERVPVVLDRPTPIAPSAPVKTIASTVAPTKAPTAPVNPEGPNADIIRAGIKITKEPSGFGGDMLHVARKGDTVIVRAKDINEVLFVCRKAIREASGTVSEPRPAPVATAVPVAPVAPVVPVVQATTVDAPKQYRAFLRWAKECPQEFAALLLALNVNVKGLKGIEVSAAAWNAHKATFAASNTSKKPSKVEGKDKAQSLGLSTQSYRVLELLALTGAEMSYKQITDRLDKVSPGAMSTIRDTLAESKLIYEGSDVINGREVVVIGATKKGIRAVESVQ